MARNILNNLIQDFKTFNGTGNLNRANDKLAEILTLLVDHIHPEKAASTTGIAVDAVKDLVADADDVSKIKTEIVDTVTELATSLVSEAVDAVAKAEEAKPEAPAETPAAAGDDSDADTGAAPAAPTKGRAKTKS